jgi:copper chaperone
MSVVATYAVTGMTCDHCVKAVTEEVSALDGVTSVDVVLVTDGPSEVTVTSDAALDRSAVAEAVDEAGYELAGG